MKLTGKLKENVAKAENKEQAKEMIADVGMELTDDELDKVNGGTYDSLIQDALDQGKEKECIRDCNGSTFPSLFILISPLGVFIIPLLDSYGLVGYVKPWGVLSERVDPLQSLIHSFSFP